MKYYLLTDAYVWSNTVNRVGKRLRRLKYFEEGSKNMKRIVLCVVAFLLGGPMMLAQLPTGTILGVVKDSTGAVVPGAKITARDTDTGQTRTVMTGTDGAYRFDALPVGNYSDHSGSDRVSDGGPERTDSHGGPGACREFHAASWASDADRLGDEPGSPGEYDDQFLKQPGRPQQTIADLPLNGRNYNDLTLLQPGVTQIIHYRLNALSDQRHRVQQQRSADPFQHLPAGWRHSEE